MTANGMGGRTMISRHYLSCMSANENVDGDGRLARDVAIAGWQWGAVPAASLSRQPRQSCMGRGCTVPQGHSRVNRQGRKK